jgi:hypothetical protein
VAAPAVNPVATPAVQSNSRAKQEEKQGEEEHTKLLAEGSKNRFWKTAIEFFTSPSSWK